MKVRQLLRHPRAILLGAANCLVLGFLTHQLLQPVKIPALPKASVADEFLQSQLPATVQDPASAEDLYAVMTGQPLFHEDRRYVPEKPVDTVAQTPPPAYALTGFLGLPGRPGRAFLQPSSGGKTLMVGLGDSVDGWTVVGVSARLVEIRQGERTYGIDKDGGSARAAAGPGPAPPAMNASASPATSTLPAMPASAQTAQLPAAINPPAQRTSARPAPAPASVAAPAVTPATASTSPSPGTIAAMGHGPAGRPHSGATFRLPLPIPVPAVPQSAPDPHAAPAATHSNSP